MIVPDLALVVLHAQEVVVVHGIGRPEAVRSRKVDHLEELEAKLSEAWSESFRERVEGWISDERDQIREIDEKIASAYAKLNDARSRLIG